MNKDIAVTGATGLVGKFVVPTLLEQGARVKALVRATADRGGFDPAVQWVEGDLLDPTARTKLVAGVDAIVHLAYAHVPGRYRGGEGDDLAGWLRANLEGTLQLLIDAKRARVPQFLFLSSRAVFSETLPGRVLDETHPSSPDTHYGAYKVAVEAFLRSFAAVEGMRTSSIRATGVYGMTWPVEQCKWWELIQAASAGKPVRSNRGGTEVHGADLAAVIVALLRNPATAPDIVHVSDLYVTQRRIVEIVQEKIGRIGPLPDPPDRPMSNVLDCPRLSELGVKLGGESLLKATIGALVDAAIGPRTSRPAT